MGFLHGVETISKTIGARKIEEVKTAVVGLVGTAPVHHVASGAPALNAITIVTDEDDLALFGPDLAAYTIPAALKAHVDGGAGVVMVINVFDPATDKTDVAESSLAITAGKITLPHQDIISATVKKIGTPDVLCVEGTDYTIDRVAGVVTIKSTGLLNAQANAKVAYSRANPSNVDATRVIGTTNGSGVRSGLQAWLGAMVQFGFNPKILIAPEFSATRTVADAMLVLAQKEKLRATPLLDVPAATTKTTAIASRAPGQTPDLAITDGRAVYCYPHVKRTDGRLMPYSPFVAAQIAKTDKDKGYHVSPSNKTIPGISTTEYTFSASLSDENCDVNQLNAAGFLTVFAAFGTGLRTWGNRSAAFPGTNGIDTFISVLRTRDVLEESIEHFTLEHLDGPINDTLINAVLSDVNEFCRTLIGRGALLPGSEVAFDPAKNPSSELQDGHITWTIRFCPPPPGERITYESILDTSLLTFGG